MLEPRQPFNAYSARETIKKPGQLDQAWKVALPITLQAFAFAGAGVGLLAEPTTTLKP